MLPALKLIEPSTMLPPESCSLNVTLLGTTAWEKAAVGATDTATPVASAVGVTAVTVGAALGVTALDADDSGPVPVALVADTVNVYVVPLVSPATVFDVAGGVPVTVTGVCAVVPMYGVTVYLVSALPPLLVGAVQLTVADASAAVAVTPVGAPGALGALGVTALDAGDSEPAPLALVADTVNVYVVPFVRPGTVVEVAGGVPVTVTGVCAVVPMYGVTVYLVSVLPPLLVGAVQLTVAWPLPAVAVTPVGVPGSPFGVTALDGDESGPVPFAVVADTLKV